MTPFSGKKTQHKHKLFGPDFPWTFLTFHSDAQGSKSFSPSPGLQGNTLFARMSMIFGAEALLLTVGAFLLTVKLLCLQSLKALI